MRRRARVTLLVALMIASSSVAVRAVAAQSADANVAATARAASAGTATARIRALSAPFRLCAGGDVTLGTNLDSAWARTAAATLRARYALSADPDSLVPALRPFVRGADVLLLNIEGAIGEGPSRQKCGRRSRNCYAFRQPPGTADALRRLVDSSVSVVGNVANNHALDAGASGRAKTMASLRAAGIYVTGRDTLATAVPLITGDTIGVLGFYTEASAPDARDLRAVERHVARAARQFGVVVVTMHLGAEGPGAQRTRNATERFLKTIDRGNPVGFADAAFRGGATLVIGHGPHVLRAAEWRGDRLVLYSLGNLLTYGPFNLGEPTNRGAVACAAVDAVGHVASADLRPTMQLWPGVLRADTSGRALRLIDSLSALDFPRSGVRVDSLGMLWRRDSVPSARP